MKIEFEMDKEETLAIVEVLLKRIDLDAPPVLRVTETTEPTSAESLKAVLKVLDDAGLDKSTKVEAVIGVIQRMVFR